MFCGWTQSRAKSVSTTYLRGHARPRDKLRMLGDKSYFGCVLAKYTIAHLTVNRSQKESVRDDVFTNTIEGYFSTLKRGVYGVYQHVSEANLKRYLGDYALDKHDVTG